MAVINASTLFPKKIEREIFVKTKGHSSLARLSNSEAVPFSGKDIFAFDFANKLALVGESAAKPAGDGTVTSKPMNPHKVTYTARFSDEFMHASEDEQMDVLQAFADAYAAILGEGIDILAMHGINPATNTVSNLLNGNYFDALVTSNVVTYDEDNPDGNINAAIAAAEAAGARVSGTAMSPTMRSALAALTGTNGPKYPDFNFGMVPERLGATMLDVNSTVSVHAAGAKTDHAIVGDFARGFRWGIAKNIGVKVIEFGDPDGTGRDLQQYNEIALRAETYIAWAIMDPASFAIVKTST